VQQKQNTEIPKNIRFSIFAKNLDKLELCFVTSGNANEYNNK